MYFLLIKLYFQGMRSIYHPFQRRMNHFRRQNRKAGLSPKIAALDLGTNACRLLVAEIQNGGIKIIDSFSRAVCLGEGLQANGELSKNAITRTISALKICKRKLSFYDLAAVRCVTTEACRVATNSDKFLRRVEQQLSLKIEVISQEEEARLALAGCGELLTEEYPYAIAFDIGGGSTEIMWLHWANENGIKKKKIIDWISLPFGVVTLSEFYGEEKSSRPIFNEIVQRVTQGLSDFSKRNRIEEFYSSNSVQTIGTSGTVTTLAALQMKLPRYERDLVDGVVLKTADIDGLIEKLLDMNDDQRNENPCLSEHRGDLICIGSAILVGIYRSWTAKHLTVADRGVREGILLDLMEKMS